MKYSDYFKYWYVCIQHFHETLLLVICFNFISSMIDRPWPRDADASKETLFSNFFLEMPAYFDSPAHADASKKKEEKVEEKEQEKEQEEKEKEEEEEKDKLSKLCWKEKEKLSKLC